MNVTVLDTTPVKNSIHAMIRTWKYKYASQLHFNAKVQCLVKAWSRNPNAVFHWFQRLIFSITSTTICSKAVQLSNESLREIWTILSSTGTTSERGWQCQWSVWVVSAKPWIYWLSWEISRTLLMIPTYLWRSLTNNSLISRSVFLLSDRRSDLNDVGM